MDAELFVLLHIMCFKTKTQISLFIYFLLLINMALKGQSNEKLYSIKQFKNSETKLAECIESYKGNNAKYLYVIIFEPMSCPRCEGAINLIKKELVKANDTTQIVLIIEYPNSRASIKYLKSRKFEIKDVLLDSNQVFKEIFKPTSNKFSIPYLLKVHLESNRLVKAYPLLGIEVDSILTNGLLDNKSDTSLIINESYNSVDIKNNIVNLRNSKTTFLQNNDEIIISNPISIYFDGTKYKYLDNLSGRIFIYDSSGVYLATLKPTMKEFKMFSPSNLPKEVMQYLITNNIANVIYLELLNENEIVASLPLIYFDSTSLDYYNQIAFINKNTDNSIISIDTVDYQMSDSYSLSHAKTYKSKKTSIKRYYIPIYKGWPAVGTEKLAKYPDNKNPFKEVFYEKKPLFAVFENDKHIYDIGELDDIYKNLRVGYYYFTPSICEEGDFVYLSSGGSGVIFKYLKGKKIDSISLFKPLVKYYSDTNMLMNAEITDAKIKYKAFTRKGVDREIIGYKDKELEYIVSYKPSFDKTISKLVSKNDRIFALILSKDEIEVVSFDKNFKKIKTEYKSFYNEQSYFNLISTNNFVYLIHCDKIEGNKIDLFELK